MQILHTKYYYHYRSTAEVTPDSDRVRVFFETLCKYYWSKDDGSGGDNWNYISAKPQSNCRYQQTNTQLFTGWMPFLSSTQQCQSTVGKTHTD